MVGFETNEFGVPRITANGALLRVNYQVDGSNNTEKDRAGIRQMPMSEIMIREVKVVTTGYAPEFGQTMGMVTSDHAREQHLQGQGSTPQRQRLVELPSSRRPTADKPPRRQRLHLRLGAPIVKERTHV